MGLQNGHALPTPAGTPSQDAELGLPHLDDEPSTSGWPNLTDICAVRGTLSQVACNTVQLPSSGQHSCSAAQDDQLLLALPSRT